MFPARLVEMNVVVDQAGQQHVALQVNYFLGFDRRLTGHQLGNLALVYDNTALERSVFCNNQPIS
jgi:hypothetical protein